ncbi:MAG TPA: hypothetical protein VI168_08500, partial [Croceibacterium sp.]
MRGILAKIGGGGLAAIVAVALAAGTIGYRLLGTPAEEPAAGAADPLAELERRADAEPDNAGAWQ